MIGVLQRLVYTQTTIYESQIFIQLFRERLSEKVHPTIPKGIVGAFECTVLQRNLKEWHGRSRAYLCECLRKLAKVGSPATVVLIISLRTISFRPVFADKVIICVLCFNQFVVYSMRNPVVYRTGKKVVFC